MAKASVKKEPHTDPRVDAYIAKAQPFAQPILVKLREIVHSTCPEAHETFKWSFPAFMYGGGKKPGILCSMAAFKEHCSFGFWNPLMRDTAAEKEGMGNYGRITSMKDLPPMAEIRKQIKTAMAYQESGIKPVKQKKPPKPALAVPDDLAAALKKSAKTRSAFDEFSPSCRREYIEWITTAKRPETRAKRLATTLELLAEGKRLHGKYQDC